MIKLGFGKISGLGKPTTMVIHEFGLKASHLRGGRILGWSAMELELDIEKGVIWMERNIITNMMWEVEDNVLHKHREDE